jgi:hypothetical protein
MAQAVGKEPIFAAMSASFEDLSVANAAVNNLNEDLTRFQAGDIEINQLQRSAEFDENSGCCLHDPVRGCTPGGVKFHHTSGVFAIPTRIAGEESRSSREEKQHLRITPRSA